MKNDHVPMPRPPRVAAWLLRRALPRDARGASIAGDLLEEFNADAATRSGIVAYGRHWRSVLSIAARYAFVKWRNRPKHERAVLSMHRENSSSLEALHEDLRYALRSLFKNRAFAAVAILTLAVGV